MQSSLLAKLEHIAPMTSPCSKAFCARKLEVAEANATRVATRTAKIFIVNVCKCRMMGANEDKKWRVAGTIASCKKKK